MKRHVTIISNQCSHFITFYVDIERIREYYMNTAYQKFQQF